MDVFWSTNATRTKHLTEPAPTRYALIGTGWRAGIFIDIARARPDLFQVTALFSRRPAEVQAQMQARIDTLVTNSLDELIATRPDFVVVAVPWDVAPQMTRALVERGIAVLSETPPAPDMDGLRSLWHDVGAANKVQVAEQYLLMPENAAALAAVRAGVIGQPGFAHVSSTHEYHAVSMIRGLLGAGMADATVRSQVMSRPLVEPIVHQGWTHSLEEQQREATLATIDFDGVGVGLYDFTANQWWNPLLPDHLTVRGSAGEIHDGSVVRMVDEITAVTSRFERAFTGRGMNLEGADATTITLDGQVLYRNPYESGRFTDDELAVAHLTSQMGSWARGEGEAPYPLAEACQDHAIALAIREAQDQPVRVAGEPWA